ncbi:SMP-30/gluconolactonase/LRE family protein [Pseudonocardiaceae bacterium YIM PH 21723]|nr:SMP-30/gluconolactonase/LRE family protein [Pseudonocardiaceae bacterium YIM PH 21723]
MAAPEVVLDAHAQLGEGPVWDEKTNTLYWVDILAGRVHAHDPSGVDLTVEVGTHVGALAARRSGGLVLAVADGFRTLDPRSGSAELLATVDHPGPAARFNDGTCDPSGAFWAGTMAYDVTAGAGILYRLDPDRRVEPMLTGVTVSNGLAFSGDGRALYYIDTPTQRIDVFDVQPDGLASRRTLTTVDGRPDGMTLDADGCLWVAIWDGSAVHRYTPDGRLDRVIEFPVRRPTSLTFGGPGLGTLYVTSAAIGTEDPLGGALFAVDAGVTGVPAHRYGG